MSSIGLNGLPTNDGIKWPHYAERSSLKVKHRNHNRYYTRQVLLCTQVHPIT